MINGQGPTNVIIRRTVNTHGLIAMSYDGGLYDCGAGSAKSAQPLTRRKRLSLPRRVDLTLELAGTAKRGAKKWRFESACVDDGLRTGLRAEEGDRAYRNVR
jgi:hypothetical protein